MDPGGLVWQLFDSGLSSTVYVIKIEEGYLGPIGVNGKITIVSDPQEAVGFFNGDIALEMFFAVLLENLIPGYEGVTGGDFQIEAVNAIYSNSLN